MKRFFTLALFMILGASAFAAQLPIQDQEFPAISNKLANPGFENGKYGWTASAGTFAVNTTAKLQGSYGASWDAGAASQTLISNSITIPEGLHGKNGLAYCSFKAASGTATHTLTVDDGTNNLVTAQTITSSTSIGPRTAVNFVFPSSGSVRLKITSAADEPTTYIDSCYLGEATNVQQISQAQLVGSGYFATTAACTFTRTNTALGALSDADCPGPTVEYNPGPGTIQTTDTDAPKFTVNNLPAGDYEVGFIGASAIATSAQSAAIAINDGTNTRGQVSANNYTSTAPFHVVGQFNYTTVANRTFELYASSAANAFNIDLTSSNLRLYFYIRKLPTSAETAYRPELFNWRVDANISGSNISLSTADVTDYASGVIEDAGLTLTNNTGNGVITAQIPCSSTNSPSGTTCSVGNESVGVAFTLPVAGDVLACVSFANEINSNGNAQRTSFQIVETPANAQTTSQEGKSRIAVGQNASLDQHGMRLCGTFTFSSAGQKVLRLRYEQDVTAITSHTILADASATVGQRDIHWEVYPINQGIPAPVLTGSITSNSTSALRIETAQIANSGSCSVTSQSSTWISSVSDPDIGGCTMTISGIFSSAPTCHCIVKNHGYFCNIITEDTTTLRTQIYDHTGTKSDQATNVMCIGPR